MKNLFEIGLLENEEITESLPELIQVGYFELKNHMKCKLCIPTEASIFFSTEAVDIQNAYLYIDQILLKYIGKIDPKCLDVYILDSSLESNFKWLKKIVIGKEIYNFDQFKANFKDFIYSREHTKFTHYTDIESYNKNSIRKLKYSMIIINLDTMNLKKEDSLFLIEASKLFKKNGIFLVAVYTSDLSHDEETQSYIDEMRCKAISVKYVKNKLSINFHDQEYEKMFSGININAINYRAEELVEFCNRAKKSDSKIRGKYTDFLEIPIGENENGQIILKMGEYSKKYASFIGGLPGSGKSTLIKHLVRSIGYKYSSDEIRVSIFDFKNGVDFYNYNQLPNVRILCCVNDSNIIPEKINKLIDEWLIDYNRRVMLFKKNGVSKIEDYNMLENIEKMPYEVLIIDELRSIYQLMGSRDQERLNNKFLSILSTHRAFGYYLIFCTQSLMEISISTPILNWLTNRISFKLNREIECYKILTENNFAPLNLDKYEIVFNDSCGIKGNNVNGYTYDLIETHDEAVKKIIEKNENSRSFERTIIKDDAYSTEFSLEHFIYSMYGENDYLGDTSASCCVVSNSAVNGTREFRNLIEKSIAKYKNTTDISIFKRDISEELCQEDFDDCYKELQIVKNQRKIDIQQSNSKNIDEANLYRDLYKLNKHDKILYIYDIKADFKRIIDSEVSDTHEENGFSKKLTAIISGLRNIVAYIQSDLSISEEVVRSSNEYGIGNGEKYRIYGMFVMDDDLFEFLQPKGMSKLDSIEYDNKNGYACYKSCLNGMQIVKRKWINEKGGA